MRGMPTFQPYAPWLMMIGRSAFLGSRAVHIVSASMSKLSSTGKPLGESGMAFPPRISVASHRQLARARPLALEMRGERQHPAVGVPWPDDLEPDRQSVR